MDLKLAIMENVKFTQEYFDDVLNIMEMVGKNKNLKSYWLKNLDRIASSNYQPNKQDILRLSSSSMKIYKEFKKVKSIKKV